MLLFYGFLHVYLFVRCVTAFGRGKWLLLATPWFCGMFALWCLRHDPALERLPDQLYFLMRFWQGYIILASLPLLVVDGLRLVLFFPRRSLPRLHRWLAPARAVPLGLVLGLCLSLYGVYEARQIRPYYQTIATTKLPQGVKRLRIVAVSDLHLSRFIGPRALEQVAAIATEAKPDIFITLGDMVDENMKGRMREAEILKAIPARYGKFGVLGNHEFYRDHLPGSLEFHKRAGITLLRGTTAAAGGVLLVGMDDNVGWKLGKAQGHGPYTLLKKAEGDKRFILFLCHRPKVKKNRLGLYDLKLSGHTHGGQVWPGSLIARMLHKAPSHLSPADGKNPDRGLVFVTTGAGFAGPPMRFLVPPEVAIIDLVPAVTR